MNSEILFVDTDSLSDTLLELKTVVDGDMTNLLNDFDSAGFDKYATLDDGSNVGVVSKADRLKNKVSKAKEKLVSLIDKSNFFVENIVSFENGKAVTLPDSSGESKPTINQETVTIEKGDTLWNMAIEKGYEGSDWQKIFKNADGSQISSVQARGFSAGDKILFVGGNESATINSGTSLMAGSLPIIGGMSTIEVLPDLSEAELQTVFGYTYSGYGEVASPFPNNSDMKITAPAGYYVLGRGATRHYGSDWNSQTGDRGEPISAVTSGIVVNVDKASSGFGNYVQVLSQHEVDGEVEYMLTTYAHMDSKSPLVEGQVINEGDFVGKVGHSGLGSGSGDHLHLETEMHLQPKDVEGLSLDDLETYDVMVENKDGTTSTITMVKLPDASTEETVNMLYGDDGAFNRSTTGERDRLYVSADSYADYINNNSLSSPKYNNSDHAVYQGQYLSANSRFEKVDITDTVNEDYEKVAILTKHESEV